MAENVMFQEAIDAVRQGQRNRARDLLTRLLRVDQGNPEYWLWMSAVVDTLKERTYCLQMVLRFDPGNSAAQRGLVLLGATPPAANLAPTPPVRRKWNVPVQEVPKHRGLRAVWENPVLRGLVFVILAVVVCGLIMGGVFGYQSTRAQMVARRPTKTPGPPPTFTITPTFLNSGVATATPLPRAKGPTPLALLLGVDYTPTPVYVNTPHPVIEAYRIGQRALEKGDFQAALASMQQAADMDPTAADIAYQMGEIYLKQGNMEEALNAYTHALELNPYFGPAYMGRAQIALRRNPQADVRAELDQAIDADPYFGEAYLARIQANISYGELEAAEKDIPKAEELLPVSPWVPYFKAQIAFLKGDADQAQNLALQANERDLTFLPAYRLMGQTYVMSGELREALKALELYTTYQPNDALAWALLGQTYYESGEDFAAAQQAFDRAIELDENLLDTYYYRGMAFLELGEGQKAVNDLVAARKLNRDSFTISMALARALFLAGRLEDARAQLTGNMEMAQSEAEQAQVYYWRAQVLEALGTLPIARKDWSALLALPEEAVPAEWLERAEQSVSVLYTPTVTPTKFVPERAKEFE